MPAAWAPPLLPLLSRFVTGGGLLGPLTGHRIRAEGHTEGRQRPSRAVLRRASGRHVALVSAVVALCAVRAAAVASQDILGTKVWLDQHLFNMTLKTHKLEDGSRVWLMSEEKAREGGLEWPVASWPTLCFIGLGASSIEYLASLAQLFPELQLALLDVQAQEWLDSLAETLGDGLSRISLASVDEFAEDRGPDRRACHAISWSVDAPPFSFYRYRELFYSVSYPLALFNMQGCTLDTRKERTDPKDKYYCEYLYSSFQSTLCGKVSENKSAGEYYGQELYFPSVDTACGENICMCHAHSDAFLDFHFEHLCRKGNPEHRFMGQWGQDAFLVNNVFRPAFRRERGIYVDVGASHPYHLSNTAYFDSCLGWRGLCMEPNPRSSPILQALRSCQVVPSCAWANSTTLRFANGGELASMTDDATLLPSEPYEMNQSVGFASTFFEAECAPLHDLLISALPHILDSEDAQSWTAGRPIVDVLSVDAEGAEVEIFKDFPFEAWDIRAIVVEVSRRTSMAIDSLLLPKGFVKIAVLGKDAVYLAPSMLPGLPPEGLKLPRRIQWNEPGTEEDTIDYFRFQRFFGVEGDLDDDVGDQRLQNETELVRQSNRTEAKHNASILSLVKAAESATFGGVLTEGERKALEIPWVQDVMRDSQVKAALATLTIDEEAFRRELRGSDRLRAKIAELYRAGAVLHRYAAEAAGEGEGEHEAEGESGSS
mmetsp:Transcript_13065/g.32614  ORF Transcript_13065/g.32614 Transcript_13065/m.32614 type:complete len:713 (+) Transcript_13065:55-2193(+)